MLRVEQSAQQERFLSFGDGTRAGHGHASIIRAGAFKAATEVVLFEMFLMSRTSHPQKGTRAAPTGKYAPGDLTLAC